MTSTVLFRLFRRRQRIGGPSGRRSVRLYDLRGLDLAARSAVLFGRRSVRICDLRSRIFGPLGGLFGRRSVRICDLRGRICGPLGGLFGRRSVRICDLRGRIGGSREQAASQQGGEHWNENHRAYHLLSSCDLVRVVEEIDRLQLF